ncbi:MAG: sugar ABC transporter ATP-binding protein [Aquamicrobium sp.]|uniref:sugar ABC transporter ATP-binding protein n=1 Tax=Aquamicrobium sp. TaxID=1872579 RepID=UPI00349ECB75|nr:sugar ABC transporter ATP-binding protein [Aquamicrobium sp.]
MPLLHVEGLTRHFGATRALTGADLAVESGEIVALMGANGAGKSTLVNIVSGVIPRQSGRMALAGVPYDPSSPTDAARAGVVTVHQSTDRVGAAGLSVADILLLNDYAEGTAPFFLSRRAVKARARALLDKAGFDLPLDADFADLRAADRQLLGIARAVAADARLLILDEPTASLSGREAARLYDVLKRLRGEGLAILYISHRIADLQALADRVAVMRGGRVVETFSRPVDFTAAVSAMIGRPLESARPAHRPTEGAPVLAVSGVRLLPHAALIDLAVHPGEVVAVNGPLGSGKSRLLNLLFGLEPAHGGAIALDGAPYAPAGPAEAIARGVALAAEDRHRSSLMPAGWPGSSLAATISLPHLKTWFPSGFTLGGRERAETEKAIARLGIKASGPFAPIETLSGGNQQKAILARWQAEPTRLLLLDEPFQGVDVGARADIIAAIRQGDGATLIATSDPEEAVEVADRIFLMQDHALTPWQAAAAQEHALAEQAQAG